MVLHHYYQKPVYTSLTSLTKYCLTKQNHYFRSGKQQGDSWKIQGVNTEWIHPSIIFRTDVILVMMMMIPFNLQMWNTGMAITEKEYTTQKHLCPLNPTRMTHFYTEPNPRITWCSLNLSLPPSFFFFFFFFFLLLPSLPSSNTI